jgi:hypothetical protein
MRRLHDGRGRAAGGRTQRQAEILAVAGLPDDQARGRCGRSGAGATGAPGGQEKARITITAAFPANRITVETAVPEAA